MLKFIVLVSVLSVIQSATAIQAIQELNDLADASGSGRSQGDLSERTCETSADCHPNFFCKNADCVAKKPEGSFCFTGDSAECQCGMCVEDKSQWTSVCLSESGDDESCPNDGNTRYNTCQSKHDCPAGHFCDESDGNACKSHLANGRQCASNDMCKSGHCAKHSHRTRLNMAPIVYHVCEAALLN